jgi:tetratricopeptide (TPR) repeat protein
LILSVWPSGLFNLADCYQARILYAKRSYHAALKIFQQVLSLNPECKPDPRIGIGLCLWGLNHKEKAKAAWQRSLEVVRHYYLTTQIG